MNKPMLKRKNLCFLNSKLISKTLKICLMVFLGRIHIFWYDSCLTVFRMSSFACVICTLTVSCDSCKVFLKKRPARTLKAVRRKILLAVMSVCQITYLAKHMLALQNHILQTPGSFKSIKKKQGDCLILHISHVATSKMSEMSFALNQKLPETFKDTLDDCFNLGRLLMISSQLPFVPLSLKIQVSDKEGLDVHFS